MAVKKKPTNGKGTTKDLKTYSELVNRALLASALGQQQYGGDRDIYEALGYKVTITFADYLARYTRQDIARAIIDKPVGATWRGVVKVVDTEGEDESPLEKAYDELQNTLKLDSRFNQLDRLSGIGRYGVLLLGLSDVSKPSEFATAVGDNPSANRRLMYVKPLTEESAKVKTWETDPKEPRYGLPLTYEVVISGEENDSTSNIIVHYSRVIHVTSGRIESETYGTPRLEPVFNRLMDLEKIVGASAEMFWRGARPGYQAKIDPDFTMTTTNKEDLEDQLDEYEHYLRRILVNEGVTYEAMATQVADPSNHVDVLIQMISAQTEIPKRILTGSERGELSSTQDLSAWLATIEARRLEFAEPVIVRQFVDRMIVLGILPAPTKGEYTVQWEDLFALTDKERVEIGKSRATALKEYALSPVAEAILPPGAFLEHIMGFSEQEIANIILQQEDVIREEIPLTEEEETAMNEEIDI